VRCGDGGEEKDQLGGSRVSPEQEEGVIQLIPPSTAVYSVHILASPAKVHTEQEGVMDPAATGMAVILALQRWLVSIIVNTVRCVACGA
jgi:hypothetical protein